MCHHPGARWGRQLGSDSWTRPWPRPDTDSNTTHEGTGHRRTDTHAYAVRAEATATPTSTAPARTARPEALNKPVGKFFAVARYFSTAVFWYEGRALAGMLLKPPPVVHTVPSAGDTAASPMESTFGRAGARFDGTVEPCAGSSSSHNDKARSQHAALTPAAHHTTSRPVADPRTTVVTQGDVAGNSGCRSQLFDPWPSAVAPASWEHTTTEEPRVHSFTNSVLVRE